MRHGRGTVTVRLPDPQRSYAVLIGASTYHFSELPDLPAVRRNLDALAEMLTDQTLGWLPPERCVVLPDPTDVRLVYRTLRRYAGLAEDTLLVYFAGHGRTGPHNELYLSMTDTDPDELRVSALPFDIIRDVLGDSPATNRVLILDCCFSGRAIQDMSGPDEAILGQIGIEGTYTLTSAPANAVALAPVGADYTAFTGELITLLRTGLPEGPELLTFATVYRQLLHTMTRRGLPLPRQRGTGTVDQLALARNVARQQGQKVTPRSQQAGEPAQAPIDTGTNHTVRPGLRIQDSLHIKAGKELKIRVVPYFLGRLVGGCAALSLIGLIVYNLIGLQTNIGDMVARLVTVGLLFSLSGRFFMGAFLDYMIIARPFDLTINSDGIRLDVAGGRRSYQWREVGKVTIRGVSTFRRLPLGLGPAIFLYPLPDTPPPTKEEGAWPFPKVEKKTGWIIFATLFPFWDSNDEVQAALALFAGSRWDPPR
jgi:Caspase domain